MAQPDSVKDGNGINAAVPKSPKAYSTFNLSRRFYTTQRYGEISPALCMEIVKGDQISYRHMMDLRTYSLKAPLMSDMFIKKDSFAVYLQSILPRNWEKIVVQPNQGDDVNLHMNGCVTGTEFRNIVSSVLGCFGDLLLNVVDGEDGTEISLVNNLDDIPDSAEVDNDRIYYELLIKYFLVAEMFFSDGALLSQLGHKFTSLYKWNVDGVYKSFDELEQAVFELLSVQPAEVTDHVHEFTAIWYDEDSNPTDTYKVVPSLDGNDFGSDAKMITFRHFLELARQNLNFSIFDLTEDISASAVNALLFESGEGAISRLFSISLATAFPEIVNFNDVSAYQLVCAHFYSNDHVDYIYSADLFRQLIWSYIRNVVSANDRVFDYNGVETQYDALSGQMMFVMLGDTLYIDNPNLYYQLNYLTAMFGFRHSLRYVDYFTGARTQPIAVGDTGVAVDDSKVDIIDTIQKKNAVRFWNFAERTGRKISRYLRDLLPGGAPAPDLHDPQFLSHSGDNITASEVSNTGAAQQENPNSITSILRTNANRFEFRFTPDRPGYIIQLCYFDAPRAYCTATDREKYHSDRYDMFNPFCQWNGSQPILRSELGQGSTDVPWAYTLNYMEYKQKYDVAAGGFVRYLPGYAFLADNNVGLPLSDNISPAYIRSWNVELDDFYIGLTGYTPASYFHFIIKHAPLIKAVRPMVASPELL